MVASLVAIAAGLALCWVAEDWSTVEFTAPDGTRSEAINHSKERAFDWTGAVLSLGGAGLLGYSLWVKYFGKKKAWRI